MNCCSCSYAGTSLCDDKCNSYEHCQGTGNWRNYSFNSSDNCHSAVNVQKAESKKQSVITEQHKSAEKTKCNTGLGYDKLNERRKIDLEKHKAESKKREAESKKREEQGLPPKKRIKVVFNPTQH